MKQKVTSGFSSGLRSGRPSRKRSSAKAQAIVALVAILVASLAMPIVNSASRAHGAGQRAPEVLFLEDFENVSGLPERPVHLLDYSNATQGTRYKASAYWSDTKYCNGFITRSSLTLNDHAIFNQYCGQNGDSAGGGQGDYMAVRAKAYALGVHAGSTSPQNNHALSTNTSGGTPDETMFETAAPIPLTLPADTQGRFLSFSVDAADTTGGEIGSPEMYFHFLQSENSQAVSTSPMPGGDGTDFDYSGQFPGFPTWARAGKVGTYLSDPFVVTGGTTNVGLRLTNTSTASSGGCGAYANPQKLCWDGKYPEHKGNQNGNDGAIDNIRILDVTPSLDKAFDPVTQSVGYKSTMILTVNNRSDLGQKNGWGFVDTLPAGLSFVNSTVGGTCQADVQSIDVAAGTLTVSGGKLPKGEASCTITAEVTATQPAVYVNGDPNGNFTNKKLIDGPENAHVEFVSGSVSWTKVGSDNQAQPLAGSVWTLTGPNPATESTPQGGWPVGKVVDCVATIEAECTGPDKNPLAGEFTIKGLPMGQYTLSEVSAPTGYISDPQSQSVSLSINAPNGKFTQDGRIVNALGSATWSKVDKSQKPLEGSEWELIRQPQAGLEAETLKVADCVSADPDSCAGMLDHDPRAGYFDVRNLKTGLYLLKETKAPAGYQMVGERGPLEISATAPKIEFGAIVNELIPGSVAWRKTDESGNDLSGSEWEIVGPQSAEQTIVVTDYAGATDYVGPDEDPRPGFFKVSNLDRGTYELKEVKAPAGYRLLADSFSFTVTNEKPEYIFETPFENEPLPPPTLPLTGGLGRDFYSFLGVGVFVLGTGVAWLVHKRRSDSQLLR